MLRVCIISFVSIWYTVSMILLYVCSYLEKLENNPDMDRSETLEHFIKSHGYSQLFQKAYLVSLILYNFIFASCCGLWSFHHWFVGSNMCFYLVMLFRSSHELLCFLSSFILSKSSPSSGLLFVQLVLHPITRLWYCLYFLWNLIHASAFWAPSMVDC